MPTTRSRLLVAVLLAGLLWLVAYPLVLVLLEGLRDPAGWTLRYVRLFLERPTECGALTSPTIAGKVRVCLFEPRFSKSGDSSCRISRPRRRT